MMRKSNADVDRVNPRTRRVRKLILDTATEVLLEQGAFDVTVYRVAERADVARTTIYRHWPTRPASCSRRSTTSQRPTMRPRALAI